MANICPCTMGNSISNALYHLRSAKQLNQTQPEQTGCAAVLSRRVESVHSLNRASSSWVYRVKFRLESGEEIELQTTEEGYAQLKEDRQVQITFSGDILNSWEDCTHEAAL